MEQVALHALTSARATDTVSELKIDTSMLEAIEKLLVLQDRDRKITNVRDELARIPTERQELQGKLASSQSQLEAAKLKVRQLESDRKKLELDVDAKKQQIEKYSLQQFQTKKNEEYRALAHEIEGCKEVIVKLEDQQLELMEQADGAQKQVLALSQTVAEAKKNIDSRLGDLASREQNLQKELATLEVNRGELAEAVDPEVRSKYDRLLKHKGQHVLVGIQHGVCGGCHMQLSRAIVVNCQAEQELVTCINCGRILYYTRDMDLAVAD
jgi:predicted  nucleic acid-binding Zn-ribbon protein